MQEVHDSTNMETFDFNQSLNREYLVDSAEWTTDMTGNQIIGTYNFPKLLFDQNYIKDKIKDFRYFKGGVRFTIRVAASKFVYGKVLCTFEPLSTGLPVISDLNHASGSPHIIVSATASEAAVFDVPFVSMFRALDLRNYTNDEIGRFTVRVLNPLIDITAAFNTAKLLITAQFVDGQVFLPHDFLTESSSMSTPAKGGEARTKASVGHMGGGNEDITNLVAGVEHDALTSATNAVFGSGGKKIAAEAGMFAAMGLSKPTSVQHGQVVSINNNYGISYGKGIDTAPKIAMDPENQISTMPVVAGVGVDEMQLAYIMGTPMLVNVTPIFIDTPQYQIATLDRNDAQITFVDWISRMFRFCSGSYKFKIYITASLMHAVRAVFYISDNAGDDWENCYHLVVDIQGDTAVEFTVPYVGKSVMKQPGEVSEFRLMFKTLSWSQPDYGKVTPIYLNVYKAAASDFQVGCLLENGFVPQSNPREDFVKEFAPIHPSVVGFAPKNLVCGEEYTTMREMVHRYHAYTQVTQDPLPVYTKPAVGVGTFGVELLGLIFRFWRGSMRFKYLTDRISLGMATIAVDDLTIMGTSIQTQMNATLEAEVPYYSNALFNHTSEQPDLNIVTIKQVVCVSGSASFPPFLMKAGGDDLSFHWLVAPPVGYFSAPTVTYGLPGLFRYFAVI